MQPLNGNVKMDRLDEFGFDIVPLEIGKCFEVPGWWVRFVKQSMLISVAM